ncbi:MAG: NUDIX hydrolase [Alphaproteobacteria bacterium]|nr:NUDIX hydrolase [Alphaproteobacteria bacterium]
MTQPRRTPTPAVGIVCFRRDEVLLIRRGSPPRKGEWSLPGGRVEWGESVQTAALRELVEETGVEAQLAGLIDVVDAIFQARETDDIWAHYVLVDFAAHWIRGEPSAGDDAAEALFAPLGELERYNLWPETARIIREAAQRFPRPT